MMVKNDVIKKTEYDKSVAKSVIFVTIGIF